MQNWRVSICEPLRLVEQRRVISPFDLSSDKATAEFKHITKRRKENNNDSPSNGERTGKAQLGNLEACPSNCSLE